MKVDFINSSYRRFFKEHEDEIMTAFRDCASQGDFMLRDETRKFEKQLAEYVGTKYAVSTNSGTDSIFLSLLALGVGPGDEVITCGHTFIATIQAIVHTGATPILVDVGKDGLMDMSKLVLAVNNKTKAIIPVHLSGKVCDMGLLNELRLEMLGDQVDHTIDIVEDAAQALGAGCELGLAGSIGDTGCFSFNFPKMMGCYGDGGAVVTSDEEVYQKLLLLRNHWNITQGSVKTDDYPPPDTMGWGWKSRMDNIQAAILNVKFKYYDQMLSRRKEIADKYNAEFYGIGLSALDDISLPIQHDGQVYQEYIIRVKDRDKFAKHMEDNGIELLIRDTVPNHKLPGLGLQRFDLPVTEKMALDQVRLPVFPELKDEEVEYIIKCVRKYYER